MAVDPITSSDGGKTRKCDREKRIAEIKAMGEGVKVQGEETSEGRTVGWGVAVLWVGEQPHLPGLNTPEHRSRLVYIFQCWYRRKSLASKLDAMSWDFLNLTASF